MEAELMATLEQIAGRFGFLVRQGIDPFEVPIVPAFALDDEIWTFPCKYCKKWHRHGPFEGHRVAHCTSIESPYRETGYILEYAGKLRAQPNDWFFPESTPERMSPSLRFDILQRDSYRCQICGATAQDGARLEVDHKHPRIHGGTNERDNLWTLCFECNRGKGTKGL